MLPFVFVAYGVVDSHLHVWDGTAAGLDAGPMKIGYSAQATASVELFMDYMDEAGVDRAVFVQPWFYHWDNRYMVSCLRRFPDRFRGVCVIDPRGKKAPAELRRWRDEGVTGIRLRPLRRGERPGRGPWLGADDTLPLWEALAETGTIVCVLHAGTDVGRLVPLLGRFPSLRIVVDHLNNPVPADGLAQSAFRALLDLARYPQVHVKLGLSPLVRGAVPLSGRPAVRGGRRPRLRRLAVHVGLRFSPRPRRLRLRPQPPPSPPRGGVPLEGGARSRDGRDRRPSLVRLGHRAHNHSHSSRRNSR